MYGRTFSACVIDFGGQWDQFLPLAYFTYKHPVFRWNHSRSCMGESASIWLDSLVFLSSLWGMNFLSDSIIII